MKYEFVSGGDMRSGLRRSLDREYAARVYMGIWKPFDRRLPYVRI